MPPLGPISLIFIQFLGKNWPKNRWTLEVSIPCLGNPGNPGGSCVIPSYLEDQK